MIIQKILLKFEPKPENILAALKEIQKDNGFIGERECQKVSGYFSVPLAQVYSVASFFDQLKTRKETKTSIKVCSGGACLGAQSMEVVRQIEMILKVELENDGHPKVKLEMMSCVGLCDRGPVMMIGENVFEKVRPEMVDDILANYL
jgi:NADH-quinone oxidoreductase subunit E